MGRNRRRPTTVRSEAIDPYQVLGVARDASPEQVRGAYRRLARLHHPDVDPSPDASERFRAIDEAYRLLASGQAPPAFEAAPPEQPVRPSQRAPADHARPAGPGMAVVLVVVAGICLSGPLLLVGGLLAPVGVLALILAAAALAGRRG